MTNDELITQFETGTLPPESFHHSDHVRLAFAYLTRFTAIEALHHFVEGLKRFAGRIDKSGLYHETITYAYFFLIHERMARMPRLDWEDFARENADLLEWRPGILGRYYRNATLKSDLARRVFVFPDQSVPLDREHLSG
jgi:hypothetical protein